MSAPARQPEQTARLVGAGVLGGAALVGLVWSLSGRAPAPAVTPPPQIIVIDPRSGERAEMSNRREPANREGVSRARLPERAGATAGGSESLQPREEAADGEASPTAPELEGSGASGVSGDSGASGANAAPKAPENPTPLAEQLLNINTASAAQLELLPGIGPALAQRIIADRAERGPFLSVDDLDRVRGIGPRTLERLRPLIRVQ